MGVKLFSEVENTSDGTESPPSVPSLCQDYRTFFQYFFLSSFHYSFFGLPSGVLGPTIDSSGSSEVCHLWLEVVGISGGCANVPGETLSISTDFQCRSRRTRAILHNKMLDAHLIPNTETPDCSDYMYDK